MKKIYRGKSSFRLRVLALLCLLVAILVFQGYQTKAQSTADYNWQIAPIGGGGFVTGIITHPTSGDRYCRTDVGGAYRWDAANEKWIQLLDWFDESESGFYGVESLALDPQNPNNIYMLCGTSYINGGRSAILKSTDKGNTFTYTDVTSQFKAHGNGSGRGNGERLVVDPNNSNVLFVGTRANGLWKSTDAGVTWNQIWTGVTSTPNGNGICFVLFDPSSNVVNGVTQTMYIGVSRTGGATLYKSTNGGTSFSDISPTTDFMPHRAALQGTTMYVTYSDHQGPQSTNGDGKVYKLNTSTGVWTNVTPVHNKDYCYGGVSIDPTNVNRVLVSTSGIYWNNQFGTGWADFIFLSTDGGSSWTLKIGPNSTYDANGMEWSREKVAINWMDCIEFDQDNLNKVRVIGGGGVYTCSDITATNTTWKYDVMGIEETALLDGISIPGGPVITSFGDVTGFVHEPLTSFPSKKLAPTDQNNQSIAYAATNPNKIVRAANEGSVVYYSTDMGSTWTASPTNMGADGRVAISADGGTILHCPKNLSTTYYTTDNGASWASCSGVSVADATPVADQVNSNYFYIFHPKTGQMYTSSDKGVSFSVVGTPGASTANYPWDPVVIRAVPGFEGHIWVPLYNNGLKYSTDHGATFTNLTNVTYCKTVGIGKTMSGASYPTVFIWGTVSGVTGLFRSTDQGNTWLKLNDDAHEFGGAPLLFGDMNIAGRVYMSAGGGRGLVYWEPSSCIPSTITPYLLIDGGSWQQTASASLTAGGSVKFGPQPVNGGSWSWSGPNGFSASTREVTISNIQANQTGDYVATYTNSGGCQSTQTFSITVTVPCSPTAITPYVQINGGTWQQTATASLVQGGALIFGPQPVTGGSWSWSGPNNFSATTREVSISNIQTNQGGSYIATYTNADGCSSTQTFSVTVTGSIVVRARGTNGDETIELHVDGNTVATWTLTTSLADYTASGSGAVEVHFTNDGSSRDVQVDYVTINGTTYQSEDQATNTGVWQNSTCGGSNSEWLNCNGHISYQTAGSSSARIGSTELERMTEAENILNDVVIYPNPTSGKFVLAFPETSQTVSVNIFDTHGKLLYKRAFSNGGKLDIDSRLKTGIYIVNARSEGMSLTKKLIIQ